MAISQYPAASWESYRRKRNCLPEIATSACGLLAMTSLGALHIRRKYLQICSCQRRSLTAATDAIGAYRFHGGRYGSAALRREGTARPLQWRVQSPRVPGNLQLPKAVTTRKGYAASVRRQSRQRLRSDRRYRRNWCIPFSRRPVRIGSIAPSEACPSPTTRKQLPCTTPDFRQNVFDISGAGGYNKDVETQTVATNITYLFPICELDHSQISESSGCDRRLTFFLSEANRRSGRDAR